MSIKKTPESGNSTEPETAGKKRCSPANHKKRRKRIWVSVGSIVLALAVVVALQWKRIQLLYYVVTVDAESARTEATESRALLESHMSVSAVDISLSDKIKASIANGETSISNVAAGILAAASSAESPSESPDNVLAVSDTGSSASAKSPDHASTAPDAELPTHKKSPELSQAEPGGTADYEYEIQLRLTELYVLQDSFTNSINRIILAAFDEYMALPKDERSPSAKISICLSKLSELSTLEDKCDAQVDTAIDELRQLLTESGGDQSIAAQARQSYKDQKAAVIATLANQIYSGGDGSGLSGKWISEHIK